MLRGSGVDQDLRRDGEERYTEMYDGYAFEVIVREERPLSEGSQVSAGAVAGRAGRLLAPVLCADAGSHAVDRPGAAGHRSLQPRHGLVGRAGEADRKAAQGRSLPGNRSPRGQMGFYIVSDGSSIPWRVRARSSSFCNLSVTHELCRGCLIADVPAIVGSLDIVMGEIDR